MKLQRRTFLAGAGIISAASLSPADAKSATASLITADRAYFFSKTNPIANRDQKELEAVALQLLARNEVQAAKRNAAIGFEMVVKNAVNAMTWSDFDQFLEAYTFRSIMMAVNSDGNYPKVLRVYNPAANWMGNDAPESKWGWENPDNAYRIIPVKYGGHYVIRGRRAANPSRHVSYVLVTDTNTSITAGLLEQGDMEIASDGTFTITLDDQPAGGRSNHIQLTPDAQYVFIRDTLSDWRQTPNFLQVDRLNPPTHPPLNMAHITGVAARIMQLGIAPIHYWMGLGQPQTIRDPIMMGPIGGLLTQMSTGGKFRLEGDEAVIITANAVPSEYHSFVIYDLWGRSLEYRNHLTSLNNAELVSDEDGSFTYVMSPRDPGIANWLDTIGQTDLRVNMRWQGLSTSAKAPSIQTRIVKVDTLKEVLPEGARKITPKQRREQIALRQQLYDMRFISS